MVALLRRFGSGYFAPILGEVCAGNLAHSEYFGFIRTCLCDLGGITGKKTSFKRLMACHWSDGLRTIVIDSSTGCTAFYL